MRAEPGRAVERQKTKEKENASQQSIEAFSPKTEQCRKSCMFPGIGSVEAFPPVSVKAAS